MCVPVVDKMMGVRETRQACSWSRFQRSRRAICSELPIGIVKVKCRFPAMEAVKLSTARPFQVIPLFQCRTPSRAAIAANKHD